jgi:hypothetical protein
VCSNALNRDRQELTKELMQKRMQRRVLEMNAEQDCSAD